MAQMLVVTGFEPFAGLPNNPSAAVLPLLPDRLGDHPIETMVLPVDSSKIEAALEGIWAKRPTAILHAGLRRDARDRIYIERIALNLLDFEDPDNAGLVLRDRPVIDGAPLALEARMPVHAILDAWRSAGIKGEISTSAGTFLCNQTFYLSLSRAPCKVGFVHVSPDVDLGTIRRALILALQKAGLQT
jgi:pyroglutamyl-peptidase